MHKAYLFLLLSFLCVSSCKCKKDPVVEPGGNAEVAPSIIRQYNNGQLVQVIKTSDDNLVGFGIADGGNPAQARMLVKLSSTDGSVLWRKELPATDLIKIDCIAPMSSGGFVVSARGTGNVSLIAFDDNGDQLWNKIYHISESGTTPILVTLTADDLLTVVAHDNTLQPTYNSTLRVLKVSTSGDSLSVREHKSWPMPGNAKILAMKDNAVIVMGYQLNGGSSNALFIKIKADGEAQYPLSLHGEQAGFVPTCIAERPGGGILCCGWVSEAIGTTQPGAGFAMRISSDMQVTDHRTIQPDSLLFSFSDIIAVDDAFIAVGGGQIALNTHYYPIALEIDNNMSIKWHKTYKATGQKYHKAVSVAQVNGRYVLTGNSWREPAFGLRIEQEFFVMDISKSGGALE